MWPVDRMPALSVQALGWILYLPQHSEDEGGKIRRSGSSPAIQQLPDQPGMHENLSQKHPQPQKKKLLAIFY